jgi:hypothetical protein
MKTLVGICTLAVKWTRNKSSRDRGSAGSAVARPDLPSRDRIEFAMSAMSDEDARWYYERLRWRS